ncbi:MAG: actin 7 [Podila humilis]|nr:MAG: actin 7 [Podila humilis]
MAAWGTLEQKWAYWDNHERFMHNAFYNHLKVAPDEHPILVTEPMFCLQRNRYTLTQIMFETFMTPALYLGLKPMLALMATGATTGLVVESGESATNVVPVYRGHATLGSLPCSITGCDLTTTIRERFKEPLDNLMKQIPQHSEHATTARKIKEQICYVSENYRRDLQQAWEAESSISHTYLLPDGNPLHVGFSSFQVPEAMFQPSILGRVDRGIHELVADAIVASEPSIQDELISNIVLTGGNTKIRGFENRLRKELEFLDPSYRRAGIVALADRECLSWLGGSMLSSLSTFRSMCLKSEDYDEIGPTIIQRAGF